MADDFDDLLSDALDTVDESLKRGAYKKELTALLTMSFADIKEAVPRASVADYSKLISVVEQASAKNLAQATLVSNIQALGKRVVSMARLVPGLAGILP